MFFAGSPCPTLEREPQAAPPRDCQSFSEEPSQPLHPNGAWLGHQIRGSCCLAPADLSSLHPPTPCQDIIEDKLDKNLWPFVSDPVPTTSSQATVPFVSDPVPTTSSQAAVR